MLREYRQTQAEHPGAVVLWRNGEFFEVYFETARLLGTELNLRVKPRPFGKETVDFTGVPLANGRDAVHRLLQRGYRVVLVEQVDEPAMAGVLPKKTIKRAVVRVFTPGTLVELDLLDRGTNNYLAAVIVDHGVFGLSYCDVSTAEFAATEFHGPQARSRLEAELIRLQPAEILVTDDHAGTSTIPLPLHGSSQGVAEAARPTAWTRGNLTIWPAWHWDLTNATESLTQQFNTASLAGFGLTGLPQATRAAGVVIQYLRETHRASVAQIDHIRTMHHDAAMLLDPQTQRNLELLAPIGARKRGALVDLLDQTLTPMGGRLLRRWIAQPLTDLAPLEARQDAVTRYVEATLLRANVRNALKGVGDLERVANRVIQGVAGIEDVHRLRDSLRALPSVAALVHNATPAALCNTAPLLPADAILDVCADSLCLLERALNDEADATGDGVERGDLLKIRHGFDPELDRVVAAVRLEHDWLRTFETREIARTGIRLLKLTYNPKTGWFIELPRATPAYLIPAAYERKPGAGSNDRYTTAELQAHETLLQGNQLRLRELERAALGRVIAEVATHGQRLLATARTVAELDVFVGLAEVAVRRRYVRPLLTEGVELEIVNGRHPIVESTMHEPFMPNDTTLDAEDAQILVVTGPNMAGKSTYLRQVALITLLAQIGSYVPADAARIGLVDRIFTRIGAQDDIATGQSTFMVEMAETASILHTATPRSLIVLDELGRGTSTYDGLSIARAVIEWLHGNPQLGCRTLFATHYHELTALADTLPRVRNYHVTVADHDDQIVFLRKVLPGKADRSYGIHVAGLAGLPRPVVRRAAEVLALLETHSDEVRAQGHVSTTVSHPAPQIIATPVHPALRQLLGIKLDELTPLAALNKLYELQALAADLETAS
ncbi:MAG: DNA mismatch repair protein MutS [Herpetosiphonaceae bacterium]|nr:DNA mismatch repair protein MutS [Herpetosiphonaceae bacterium]